MHLFHRVRRTVTRAATALPLLTYLIIAGGCFGNEAGPTGGNTGTVTVAASITSASIAVGMPAVAAVTVTRAGGFLGTVLLNADSLPTGVSASFEPAVLAGEATTAIMTLTAGTDAVVAIDTINIRAVATDLETASTTVEVSVAKGEISLSTPAAAVTVAQGGTGSVPLTIARSNGFATGVTLLAEGLPDNVTATFTPALLPNGTLTSTLILAAGSGAAIGSSSITVRARGYGVADKTSVVQLSVAALASQGFTMSISPAAISVVAGGSSNSVITVGRTGGFTGVVTQVLTGLPAGATATLTQDPNNANAKTITIAATAAVVPGAYTVQVTGTASGAPAQIVPLVLLITPVPGVKVDVAPATLRIAPGGFAQAAVLLTRVAGFTGDFVMTAEGMPAGLTASFSPAPVIGTATTVTFAATAATAPGTYNITIKATAGSDFGTFTVPVTVGSTALRQ